MECGVCVRQGRCAVDGAAVWRVLQRCYDGARRLRELHSVCAWLGCGQIEADPAGGNGSRNAFERKFQIELLLTCCGGTRDRGGDQGVSHCNIGNNRTWL